MDPEYPADMKTQVIMKGFVFYKTMLRQAILKDFPAALHSNKDLLACSGCAAVLSRSAAPLYIS